MRPDDSKVEACITTGVAGGRKVTQDADEWQRIPDGDRGLRWVCVSVIAALA